MTGSIVGITTERRQRNTADSMIASNVYQTLPVTTEMVTEYGLENMAERMRETMVGVLV